MPRDTDVLPQFERGEITFLPIPLFTYTGDVASEVAAGMTKQEAISLLDHMLAIRWDSTQGWHGAQVLPYGPLALDPAASSSRSLR